MVDILNNRDEKSAEYSLVKKFRQMSEELGQLRLNTIASVRIDGNGALTMFHPTGFGAVNEGIISQVVFQKGRKAEFHPRFKPFAKT